MHKEVAEVKANFPREAARAAAALAAAEAAWKAERERDGPLLPPTPYTPRYTDDDDGGGGGTEDDDWSSEDYTDPYDEPDPYYWEPFEYDEEEEEERPWHEEDDWEAPWRAAEASPAWAKPAEALVAELGREPLLAPLLQRHFAGRHPGGAPHEEWRLVSQEIFMSGLPEGTGRERVQELVTDAGGTGGTGQLQCSA